jgi:glutathione S-transferase
LRRTQALLTLLGDRAFATGDLPAADAATLARCVGVVDTARLDRDITNATDRVYGWYRRLIADPAKGGSRSNRR